MLPDEAEQHLDAHPLDRAVVQPYLTGQDLNFSSRSAASRYAVNFGDWSLDQAQASHPELVERLRQLVMPERQRSKRESYRTYWWRYAEHRPGLTKALRGVRHVLALTLNSATLMPLRLSADQVFANKLVVFILEDYASLAMLSSAVHIEWAIRYSTPRGAGLTYVPSLVFETLPRPAMTQDLEKLGRALHEERYLLMTTRSLGLTKLYNLVHDPAITDRGIVRLRQLHEQVDFGVLEAYGWDDIDLNIGHHRTKIGTRWTVSPKARFELLDRLLVENQRRAALSDTRSPGPRSG